MFKKYVIFPLFSGWLLLVSTSFYLDKQIAWLQGSWEGIGYQPQTQTNWNISLEADMKEKKFMIRYPSLNCSGQWKLLKLDKNQATLEEIITEDAYHSCDPHNYVVLTRLNEKYITYTCFSYPDKQLIAFSTLTLVKR
jgi:hypothetical protein